MSIRRRLTSHLSDFKSDVKAKATSRSAWILPKESNSFAPEDTWTNKDNDVTPPSRRTWTSWTILGFWFSDALNMQGWENPSSIIAIGLTWREAILCNCMGMVIVAIPLVLNGAIGSALHVPYPVAARSGFGFHFAKFAVVVRMVTALFWHSIQTYSGSFALTNCISAIWPSYLTIPNHIPENIGVTSQQLASHTLFWFIQLPILLIPPHKLKWFFAFKTVVVMASCIGVAAGMTHLAKSHGDMWDQKATIHGSEKAWKILSCMMSSAGGWATMATNIPDFTRYMRGGKGQYWQGLFLPVISTFVGIMAIISTSCAGVVYGEYIWDPTSLAAKWNSPAGRAAKFFVGFSWVVGQIGTNLSANVITAANDMTSLFPKYINIRRGALLATIIGGWVMQPWKIENSASQLLTFMSGLAVFLAPVAAILAADWWIVKRKHVDVPALYNPHGRYQYWHGINWRAVVTFIISLTPNLPGLANSVTPSLGLTGGIVHVWDINYLYGFWVAVFVYSALSLLFPEPETLIPETVSGDSLWKDESEDVIEAYNPATDSYEEVSSTEKIPVYAEKEEPKAF